MSEKTGEKTVFTWRDGTVTEASLKQITEGFAGKTLLLTKTRLFELFVKMPTFLLFISKALCYTIQKRDPLTLSFIRKERFR